MSPARPDWIGVARVVETHSCNLEDYPGRVSWRVPTAFDRAAAEASLERHESVERTDELIERHRDERQLDLFAEER